jgi:hypothetical protein
MMMAQLFCFPLLSDFTFSQLFCFRLYNFDDFMFAQYHGVPLFNPNQILVDDTERARQAKSLEAKSAKPKSESSQP